MTDTDRALLARRIAELLAELLGDLDGDHANLTVREIISPLLEAADVARVERRDGWRLWTFGNGRRVLDRVPVRPSMWGPSLRFELDPD
jgi:hypothetical protein